MPPSKNSRVSKGILVGQKRSLESGASTGHREECLHPDRQRLAVKRFSRVSHYLSLGPNIFKHLLRPLGLGD